MPFARYDDVKTETSDGTDLVRKGTIGSSFRLYDTEVTGGRAVIEAFRQKEGVASTTGGLVNLLWAF